MTDFIENVSDWCFNHLGWFLAIGIPTLMVLFIFAAVEDQKDWSAYAKQHHCIVAGKKKGQTSTGFSMDGKMTMVTSTTPDQTIYTCDEGEIQIR